MSNSVMRAPTAFVTPLPPLLSRPSARSVCQAPPLSTRIRQPACVATPPPPATSGATDAPSRTHIAPSPASSNGEHEDPIPLISGIEEYLAAVRESQHKLVVLKIFAPWCRSCRALAPKVRRLAREFEKDVSFFRLDYEQNKELSYRLGVSSMPTFVFYRGAAGEIEKFSCGPLRADVLRQKIEDCLSGVCQVVKSDDASI